MNHSEALRLLGPYRDGELDLAACLPLEEHLAGCPLCQQSLAGERALADLVQAEAPRFAAPPLLETRIRAMLRKESAPSSEAPFWRRCWQHVPQWLSPGGLPPVLAGGAVAFLIVAAGSFWTQGVPTLEREAVADHVRSLQAAHLLDVASTDQHTVKPWFAGKLDYSPPVVDLAPSGYPLVGGRLDVLARRDVAALVYQRRKHEINLFVWPSEAGPRPGRRHSQDGYHVLGWTSAGMNYLAVSELGEKELREFAGLIQAQTTPNSPRPE